jgi:hypothetical protein
MFLGLAFATTGGWQPGRFKVTIKRPRFSRRNHVVDFSGTLPTIRAFIQLTAKEITMMQTSITLCRLRLA